MQSRLVLIKHAMPVLEAGVPAREWRLGDVGEAQARRLAQRLADLKPTSIVSSIEPKAWRTAEIIAGELGLLAITREGLEELDRPALPILSTEDHLAANRPIFDHRGRAAIGGESADAALERFAAAIGCVLADSDSDRSVVVITHGTVMALYGGAHSPVNPWRLWRRLKCGDSLIFALPGLRLIVASTPEEIIEQYEHHAVAFDAHRSKVLFERRWLDLFGRWLPDGGSVLDVGCGAGDPLAKYFVEGGYRLCGVDSSSTMLRLSSGRFPDHDWIRLDMREMDLGREFDGILAWNSFFHLAPDEQRAMFPVFRRHTRPGGVLMFTSGSEHGEIAGVLEGDPIYHASLAREEYAELLGSQGFAVLSYIEDDPACGHHTVWLARLQG